VRGCVAPVCGAGTLSLEPSRNPLGTFSEPSCRYFVSGGFASIGEDSKLAVSTLMAAPLEELDADAIKTGLAQYQAAYEKATDDMVKSEAEIGVEVYQAMSYAISEA